MSTPTPQEVYDKTVLHLRTQNKKSDVDSTNNSWPRKRSCMYRAPEGLSCAVGCHIPNARYNKDMEGMSVFQLIAQHKLFGDWDSDTHRVLIMMQLAHDGSPVRLWEDEFRRVATALNLLYTPKEA